MKCNESWQDYLRHKLEGVWSRMCSLLFHWGALTLLRTYPVNWNSSRHNVEHLPLSPECHCHCSLLSAFTDLARCTMLDWVFPKTWALIWRAMCFEAYLLTSQWTHLPTLPCIICKYDMKAYTARVDCKRGRNREILLRHWFKLHI